MVWLWKSQLKAGIFLSLIVGVTGINTSILLLFWQTDAIAQISQLSLPQNTPESISPASPTQSLPPSIQTTPAAPVNPPAPANPPKPVPSKKPADTKKQPVAEEFPSNPLEITQPDPLIPYDYKDRPLTAQEIRQLRVGANRLAIIGATKLEQGDRVAAFNAWNRELRFRRLAGPLTEEVLTLGRVGDVAWRESDTTQLRWITKRLDEILAKMQTDQSASKGQLATPVMPAQLETLPPDLSLELEPSQPSKITESSPSSNQPQAQTQTAPTLTARQLFGTLDTNPLAVGGVNALVILGSLNREVSLLDALGFAYQQVRLPQTAVKVYQQLLAEARRRNDSFKLEATLITLGQLHLAWFDYGSAVQPYQELLARSRSRRDPINFPLYLDRLAYIHEQAKQPAQAIPYQAQLITFHQTALGDAKLIPALTLKIADNHRRLAQLDQAETNYQLAYKLAIPLLQFAHAADALKKLGDLYRANNRLDSALRMYAFLVEIEQQAYNTYGVMDAYDQTGQVHLLRKEYPEAIAAFQQALPLAQQLKFREDYFATRIQKASESKSE
ncbi:tetratricopeptide repeat protein [Leptolyngbya sp. Cla-17]|uniref:tetratricopeptide repeat protein n=1 Tax=Leptolyngbya sp. Cla-17 TaxID=2803751 RepID=UPI001492DE99|nr:tetratricopeptide repeat protein [Leptolyngbya sp. Cla-17]